MTQTTDQRRREAQAETGKALLRDTERKFEAWRRDPAAGAAQAKALRDEATQRSRAIQAPT